MKKNGANTGRTVVITGASTGIGHATALHLSAMGFQVFAGVRRAEDGEALKRKASRKLTPVILDVTDDASITAATKVVRAAVGARGLAGLVNNAGISVAGPLEFLPPDDIRRQLEVNLIGPIAVTQAFLPLLRTGHGRIVNIGSIGGRMSTPFLGAYSASKFGLEAITDSLRMELRPWGISVSIIEPGGIATPLWDRGRSAADELLEKLPERTHELYGAAIEAMRKASTKFEKRAIGPEAVAKAVAHALTAKNPKTRYLVGMDAHIQALLATVVPDRARDWLVAQQVGLPKKR